MMSDLDRGMDDQTLQGKAIRSKRTFMFIINCLQSLFRKEERQKKVGVPCFLPSFDSCECVLPTAVIPIKSFLYFLSMATLQVCQREDQGTGECIGIELHSLDPHSQSIKQ